MNAITQGEASSTPLMKIGNALINRVEEMRIPNKISYFTDDKELLENNRYWLYPHFLDDNDGFDLVFQSWIIEVDDRVVLIDPCHGNGKVHPVPYFHMLDVPYIERMSESGYRPEDIDLVVCTHLHHDHCGWNTQLRNGKWIPTFPNARYIIRKLEYDLWQSRYRNLDAEDLNQGVFERSVQPVMEAGLMDLVTGSHRLTEGLVVEPAPGHTEGHQMLHLLSANQHALFTGDCFHHPIQLVEPSIPFAGGYDMRQVIKMRKHLVDFSAEFEAKLIAAHIPAPYTVRALRSGNTTHFIAGG